MIKSDLIYILQCWIDGSRTLEREHDCEKKAEGGKYIEVNMIKFRDLRRKYPKVASFCKKLLND